MARIDEQRKQRLEQALRDMGNYGVKLRKPEELPDFDQSIDYEEEKKRFEPVKVEEQNDKESHKDYSQPSYQETELSPTERATSTEENHQRMGKTRDRKQLSEFQGEISPALSQQPPQSRVCIRGNSTKVGLRGEENR